jgi:hypothetical protein
MGTGILARAGIGTRMIVQARIMARSNGSNAHAHSLSLLGRISFPGSIRTYSRSNDFVRQSRIWSRFHVHRWCVAPLINPMAVPGARIATAGKIIRATIVSLWVAPALDHAVYLQHREQLAIQKKTCKLRNCDYEIKNLYS